MRPHLPLERPRVVFTLVLRATATWVNPIGSDWAMVVQCDHVSAAQRQGRVLSQGAARDEPTVTPLGQRVHHHHLQVPRESQVLHAVVEHEHVRRRLRVRAAAVPPNVHDRRTARTVHVGWIFDSRDPPRRGSRLGAVTTADAVAAAPASRPSPPLVLGASQLDVIHVHVPRKLRLVRECVQSSPESSPRRPRPRPVPSSPVRRSPRRPHPRRGPPQRVSSEPEPIGSHHHPRPAHVPQPPSEHPRLVASSIPARQHGRRRPKRRALPRHPLRHRRLPATPPRDVPDADHGGIHSANRQCPGGVQLSPDVAPTLVGAAGELEDGLEASVHGRGGGGAAGALGEPDDGVAQSSPHAATDVMTRRGAGGLPGGRLVSGHLDQ